MKLGMSYKVRELPVMYNGTINAIREQEAIFLLRTMSRGYRALSVC